MRATARNNLTFVKRDPWYAYEPLWNSVRFPGHPGSGTAKLSRFRAVDQNRSKFATTGIFRGAYNEEVIDMYLRSDDLIVPSSCRLPFRRHDDPSRPSGRSCLWRCGARATHGT